MSWFANLKLLPKLMLAFALVLVMTTGLGLFAKRQLSLVNDASTELSSNWMPSIEAIAKLRRSVNEIRITELSHAMSSDDSGKAAAGNELKRLQEVFASADGAYAKLISSPDEQALYDTFKSGWAAYAATHDQVLKMSSIGETEQARQLSSGKGKDQFDQIGSTLDKLIAINHQGGVDASTASQHIYSVASWSILVCLAVTVTLGMLMAYLVSKVIVTPINQVVSILNQVSQGDLTQHVQHDRQDELGDMQKALGRMVSGLSSMVAQVRTGADSVATASSQIAQGNLDLSSRTEEQASSLQQTAASIEEMSGTVRTNADNAHQANQLASAASAVASRGGEVVTQVIETMNDIQTSSRKISDIIGVIDGIAFQTNILALNAAVEAARAGEQGRGFAVVAGEVRSLAQRSAQAAREIKTLISDSVEKVNAGSQLVGTAGATMSDVVTQVRKVTDLVGEIAHASTEQSQGVGQINQAVSQLDQTTQQNAALVEESMAAAESLKSQADRLTQAVGVFRTSQAHDVMAQPAAEPMRLEASKPAHPTPAKMLGKAVNKAVSQVTHRAKPSLAHGSAQPATPQLPLQQAKPVAASADNGDDWETF